jgi:hypothetical protein
MFKQPNLEDELLRAMEKSLVKNQTEIRYGFDKLAKATDLLNQAAAIFESANMNAESEEILDILQGLAQEIK